MSNYCCFIPDQSKLDQWCQNNAKYRIISGPSPDDYTESCGQHLEQMLDDSIRFEICRFNGSVENWPDDAELAPRMKVTTGDFCKLVSTLLETAVPNSASSYEVDSMALGALEKAAIRAEAYHIKL